MYYDVSSVFSLDFLLLSLQKVFNFAGNSIKGNILRKTHLVNVNVIYIESYKIIYNVVYTPSEGGEVL